MNLKTYQTPLKVTEDCFAIGRTIRLCDARGYPIFQGEADPDSDRLIDLRAIFGMIVEQSQNEAKAVEDAWAKIYRIFPDASGGEVKG